MERLFDGVSHANTSKIDRSAMGTSAGEHCLAALALLPRLAIVAARFAGCFDFFVRAHVRLGKFHPVFGPGNLAFVSLR